MRNLEKYNCRTLVRVKCGSNLPDHKSAYSSFYSVIKIPKCMRSLENYNNASYKNNTMTQLQEDNEGKKLQYGVANLS